MSELHFLTTPATRLIDTCMYAGGIYIATTFSCFFERIQKYISNPNLFTKEAFVKLNGRGLPHLDRAYKKAKYAIDELSSNPDMTLEEFIDQLDEDGKYVPIIKGSNYGIVLRLEQVKTETVEEWELELKAGWK